MKNLKSIEEIQKDIIDEQNELIMNLVRKVKRLERQRDEMNEKYVAIMLKYAGNMNYDPVKEAERILKDGE